MTRQIQATDIHLPDRWMHRDGSAARCRGQHRGGIPSSGLAYLVSFEVAAATNSLAGSPSSSHTYHCVPTVITPWRVFVENAFSSPPILITDSRSSLPPDDDPLTVARTSGFCTRRSERREWNPSVYLSSWRRDSNGTSSSKLCLVS